VIKTKLAELLATAKRNKTFAELELVKAQELLESADYFLGLYQGALDEPATNPPADDEEMTRITDDNVTSIKTGDKILFVGHDNDLTPNSIHIITGNDGDLYCPLSVGDPDDIEGDTFLSNLWFDHYHHANESKQTNEVYLIKRRKGAVV
jgi:hypothetical protein